MKKVHKAITNVEAEQYVPTVVDESKYYGVIQGGTRGFITRVKYGVGEFIIRVATSVTKGNGWERTGGGERLDVFLNSLIASGYSVYEFETPKELFTWLVVNEDN